MDRLFFELASESRLGILRQLGIKELKMQEVAQKLDLTDTEACRQLQRLSDAKLVEKRLDGKYSLTSYAKLVQEISSPLDFVSMFRDYFLAHDASFLPYEFRARLKELSLMQLSPVILETMNKVAAMLRNSEERIDCTIEVGGDLHIQIMLQRLTEGLKVRWLMQESFLDKARTLLLSTTKIPEIRVTPRIPLHLYLTEKEAACCLRNNEGIFDYSTLFGDDPASLKWTNDLYNYEWQKARPFHR